MDWTNLSSLLWLLAIGGLFYWMMMKGGCGGHGGHAHGGGHRAGGEAAKGAAGSSHEAHGATVRDPVCGMQVDPGRAAGMRTAAGQAFYFCSTECVAKFDRDPEGYARRASETGQVSPAAPTRHHFRAGR